MNTSAKGNRKQNQCLKELKEGLLPSVPIISWTTYRSRAGGNDLFGDDKQDITGFDLGLLFKDHIIFVQVDDSFEKKRWESLKQNWEGREGVLSYYAIYNHKPRIFEECELNIKLPNFYLLLV